MQVQAKWHTVNQWGEQVYKIPFAQSSDARNFARFVSSNISRFSLIGCHRTSSGWEVAYRPRKEYPWAASGYPPFFSTSPENLHVEPLFRLRTALTLIQGISSPACLLKMPSLTLT